jgi:uncharacterized protein YndB with AHSA1/START domain
MSPSDTARESGGRRASPQPTARSVERTVEIDAPLGAVWRALTDADELTRWFPLEARVEPGAGGSIWMRWSDVYGGLSRIEVWEPEAHLRIAFPTDGPGPVATDYYLQGRSGRTVLRVVSSGFGAGVGWDDFFDGVRRGWAFELTALRHYLERHHGEDRVVAWVRVPYAFADAEAWRRLTGPGGWLGADGLDHIGPGSRYQARTVTGTDLVGSVHAWQPPMLFAGTVEGLREALLRLELERWGETRYVNLWLATYGVPAADVGALESAWRSSLAEALEA